MWFSLLVFWTIACCTTAQNLQFVCTDEFAVQLITNLRLCRGIELKALKDNAHPLIYIKDKSTHRVRRQYGPAYSNRVRMQGPSQGINRRFPQPGQYRVQGFPVQGSNFQPVTGQFQRQQYQGQVRGQIQNGGRFQYSCPNRGQVGGDIFPLNINALDVPCLNGYFQSNENYLALYGQCSKNIVDTECMILPLQQCISYYQGNINYNERFVANGQMQRGQGSVGTRFGGQSGNIQYGGYGVQPGLQVNRQLQGTNTDLQLRGPQPAGFQQGGQYNTFGGSVQGGPGGSVQRGQLGGSVQRGQLGGSVQRGQLGGSVQRGQLGGSVQRGQLGGSVQRGQFGGSVQRGQLGGSVQRGQLGGSVQGGPGGSVQGGPGGSVQRGQLGGSVQGGPPDGSAQRGQLGESVQGGQHGVFGGSDQRGQLGGFGGQVHGGKNGGFSGSVNRDQPGGFSGSINRDQLGESFQGVQPGGFSGSINRDQLGESFQGVQPGRFRGPDQGGPPGSMDGSLQHGQINTQFNRNGQYGEGHPQGEFQDQSSQFGQHGTSGRDYQYHLKTSEYQQRQPDLHMNGGEQGGHPNLHLNVGQTGVQVGDTLESKSDGDSEKNINFGIGGSRKGGLGKFNGDSDNDGESEKNTDIGIGGSRKGGLGRFNGDSDNDEESEKNTDIGIGGSRKGGLGRFNGDSDNDGESEKNINIGIGGSEKGKIIGIEAKSNGLNANVDFNKKKKHSINEVSI